MSDDILNKPIGEMSMPELTRLISQVISRQVPPIPTGLLELADLDKAITVPADTDNADILQYDAAKGYFVANPPVSSLISTDGLTPGTPAVTIVGGPGWIQAKWAIAGTTADPLYYKVFCRAGSAPTTADDTYLVGTTTALSYVINELTGGTQLSTGTTYHVKVVAYSQLSGGATSAASADATGTPDTVDASVTTISNINASTITTGTLDAARIAAGSLDAGKITSATITATQINASAGITAGMLSVSTLSAITANLGTITAGTVTGATLQTASSGARVVIDSTNGLRGFNSGSTDYGAGAGVIFQIPLSGDPFLAGTVYATQGVKIDAPTSSGVDHAHTVNWVRSDATKAAYLQCYTSADLEDANVLLTANPQDTGATALTSQTVVAANSSAAAVYSYITLRYDRDAANANTGYVKVSSGGNEITLIDSATDASLLHKVDFSQVSSVVGPSATVVRLNNQDDGLGRSTLMVSREGTVIQRDLASAITPHGNSLRQNMFLYTDCGQTEGTPPTNSFIAEHFLVGFVGTGSQIADLASQTNMGVWRLTMGTTASTSFCNVTSLRDFPGTNAYRIYLGCIFKVPTASNATDRFDIYIGFLDGTDPRAVTDGIFIRYSDSKATPAGTASTFDLVQCSGGSRSADALDDNGGAITLTAGSWYMVELEIVPGTGTSVWFTEPGGTKTKKVTSYNTNFPSATNACQFRVGIKRAAGSSNARQIDVDAIWARVEYGTNRVP